MSLTTRRIGWLASSLLGGLLLAESAQAQAYYRWVDANGKVQYSDQKPVSKRPRPGLARKPATSADVLMRNHRRNTAGAARAWADSTRRFAPRVTTPSEAADGSLRGGR